MTLTIDDVIALRANCDDYVNAFKVLVRLYTTAKKCGIGYFNYNIMPFDGNNANPLRAVYYAARLLELPKPILYCV